MALTFIGIGSAFNTKLGNTSAFLRHDKALILIDSGSMVFHRLMEQKLLDGLKQLDIIITHTHPDHVGSLGEVIFYCYYEQKIIPTLYFPEAVWLRTFLKHVGVEDDMYRLRDAMSNEIKRDGQTPFQFSYIPVSHLNALHAYGFVFEQGMERYYYSGDTNELPQHILNDFVDGRLTAIYQDTCGLDYEGNPHLSFTKLCTLIPPQLREKVYCMHHDQHLNIDLVLAEGFKIPPVLLNNT